MLPQNSQRRRGRITGSLVAAIILFVASVFILLNRQYIIDSIHFWSYRPTSEIAAIAQRAELTDQGVFTFYSTQPEINASSEFNGRCGSKEQNTAILGCYVNDRIYLYNVTDARLNGIKEVTAAHEMLHAVYQRLGDDEKAKVNQLVEAEYAKLQADNALSERMAYYARTEPGERDNELQSIIGTEITTVSAELEQHYAKYFSDRSVIVKLYDSYNQTFKQIKEQLDSLTAKLDTLKKEIDEGKVTYESDYNRLEADIAVFKQKADSGQYTEAQFNADRRVLVARANNIDAQRDRINAKADEFNTLLDEYENLALQKQDLFKSMDSNSLTTPPKV